MNKEALLALVGTAEMSPLIDQEEHVGVQIGWYKMCNEPIPALDKLVDEPTTSITVDRRHVANTYQYIVHCPLSWFA